MMKNSMTRLGNDRQRLLKIGGLMLASALIGAFIVMNLNLIPLGFAGPGAHVGDLGPHGACARGAFDQ